jgi:hypothetical protein
MAIGAPRSGSYRRDMVAAVAPWFRPALNIGCHSSRATENPALRQLVEPALESSRAPWIAMVFDRLPGCKRRR